MDKMKIKAPQMSKSDLYDEIAAHLSASYNIRTGFGVNVHSWQERRVVNGSKVETEVYMTYTDENGAQGTDSLPGTLWEILH